MGAPRNRAERGRVSVQPNYPVNQMPETKVGCKRKEPRVKAEIMAGAPPSSYRDAFAIV